MLAKLRGWVRRPSQESRPSAAGRSEQEPGTGPPAVTAAVEGSQQSLSAPSDDGGFRVLTDDELVAAVAGDTVEDGGDADMPPPPAPVVPLAGGPAPPPAPSSSSDVKGCSSAPHQEMVEEKEKWDCCFTHQAMEAFAQGGQEGDPIRVNEYSILEHLGSGSFGAVKVAERHVGKEPYQKYAIKMLSRMRLRRKKQISNDGEGGMIIKTAEDMVRSEVEVMRRLFHRNVVLLFEVIDDSGVDNIYLVQEFLEGGRSMLFDSDTRRFRSPLTGGTLTEPLAAKLFFGLVSGLQYLHSRRICHRDIKPENLLLTDGTKLRITDFGCAIQFKPGQRTLVCDTAGTLSFLAPECCGGEAFDPFLADTWAAAVTLYCFMYGQLPYVKDGLEPLLKSIQEDDVPYPEEVTRSAELIEMMDGLLCKRPEDRWTLDRLKAHEWLTVPRREDEEEDKRKEDEA